MNIFESSETQMQTLYLKLWADCLTKLRRARVQIWILEEPHRQSFFKMNFHYHIQHNGDELLNTF